ncbi:hypothetical protein KAR91_70850 [Candidatus Pacearchaeota archaeon]|nr:hypothetical protein [Candidatus Pacearchaeota archaeon]
MSTIDESYFINDIAIAGTNNPPIVAGLNSSIVKREKEALISVFGYELYELFIANPAVQIYKDILDGKEFSFEFCGKTVTRKWVGLANTEKISLLAYYTYFFYEKDRNEFNSGVGFVKPKVENAVQENPRLKFVNAWNQYVFQKGDHSKINKCSGGSYLRGRRYRPDVSYFKKFDLTTYEFLNDDPSLFNFMLANVSDYPTWEFTPEKNINLFDL